MLSFMFFSFELLMTNGRVITEEIEVIENAKNPMVIIFG